MGGCLRGVAVPEVSSEKEGEEAKGSGSGNSLMARKDTVQKILLESRAKPRVGVAKDGPEEWAILRGENRGRVCALILEFLCNMEGDPLQGASTAITLSSVATFFYEPFACDDVWASLYANFFPGEAPYRAQEDETSIKVAFLRRCHASHFREELHMLPLLKDSKVPVVAATMREHFEALGGDNVVGVFRLAPNKDECDVIKEVLLRRGKLSRKEVSEISDVNIFANLIKVWFRDQPQNLLDGISTDILRKISRADIADVNLLLSSDLGMEQLALDTLRWLLDLLTQVARNREENKMSAKNLAIVVAPNLFSNVDGLGPMEMLQHSQVVVDFLERCLEAWLADAPSASGLAASQVEVVAEQ
eukprot:g615.t1